jgi:hypothetical protein
MDDVVKIKKELYLLYKDIKNKINKNKNENNINKDNSKNDESIDTYNSLELISIIKKYLVQLINQQSSIINHENNNNNDIVKHYNQLENHIKKLERDNKYYLQNLFYLNIQKNSLDMRLSAYIGLEEAYEELRTKVKFEEGKFLDNDRKDNEIIIIRNENSVLKKEIIKLEKKNKNSEKKKKEYEQKILTLQENIENLNKTIFILEREIKDNIRNKDINNCYTNIRKNSHQKRINQSECSFAIQNIYNLNSSNSKKRIIDFFSPKKKLMLENYKNKNDNTINSLNLNAFSGTIYKMINDKKNRKIMIPLKKIKAIKQSRNHSISVVRRRETDRTILSMNKLSIERKDKTLEKNITKNRTLHLNMKNMKNNQSSLSSKHSNNNKIFIQKVNYKI